MEAIQEDERSARAEVTALAAGASADVSPDHGRGGTLGEGDLALGMVVGVDADHAEVELPGGLRGQVPRAELGRTAPAVGDKIHVLVEQQRPDGAPLLSREKGERLHLWHALLDAFEAQRSVEGEIVARVEGGYSVDVGVKAFLPGSQVDLQPSRDADRYVGQRFLFRIIKFHKNRGNIVLSRRVLLEEARARTMEKVQPGAVVDGVVKSFTDYGAFIDLGGVQGLLHVTDMSWGRVSHPSEMFAIGDAVRLKVLKVDPATTRISLGLRQLQEDPWVEAERKYPVGAEVSGSVISITDYGVFLSIEVGVEGLVHTTGPFAPTGRDLLRRVSIGERLNAVVLETDVGRKRISLRLKTEL